MGKLRLAIAALMLTACSSESRMDAGSSKPHTRGDAGQDAASADAAAGAASGHGLSGIWGSDVDDIWAVGEAGTILHYDGEQWTASDSATTISLHAVSGTARDDVWAVGESIVLHWDGKRWSDVLNEPNLQEILLSVWAAGPDSVFMVGLTTDTNRGLLRHGKGTEWGWIELGRGAMWEVWGSSPTDVWLGGSNDSGLGFLARGDGENFEATEYKGGSVRGIWGASSDDVWAVPYDDKFQHWNGSSWSAFNVPDLHPIIAVAGSGPKDVWAVGLEGTIVHWDGDSWKRTETGTDANLFGVWPSNAHDAWAVGQDGIILHWNGSEWRDASAR